MREGLSKNEWTKKYEVLKTLGILTIVISVILAFAASSPVDFADRSLGKKILFVVMVVWLILQIILLLVTVFYITIGRRFYRMYAKRFIDYNDDDPIRKIEVRSDKIILFFDEGRVVQREVLEYGEYDIKAVMRENYEKPTFYIWDGYIAKVVLPYTDDLDNAKWSEYSVRKMKKKS